MQQTRTIYFTSPWMPCGSFWLANCLLELGIKVSTYRKRGRDWRFDGTRHHVAEFSRFATLLPAFQDNDSFLFRPDIEVVWGHIFPYSHLHRHKVLLFTRDPRDAMYYQYLRERPYLDLSYQEWLHWPFHESLLDKMDNWRLYHRLWEQHNDLAVFRFEDYCRNSARTLQRVLDFIGISVEPASFEHALWRSSYERYCAQKGRPFDPDKVRHDAWMRREGEEQAQLLIEQAAGTAMSRYRYLAKRVPLLPEPDPSTHMALNPFFHDIPLLRSKPSEDPATNLYVRKTLAFCKVYETGAHANIFEKYRDLHTFRELDKNIGIYLHHARQVGLMKPAPMPVQEVCA
ncbi:MAG: sulfotransferase domain-containing protein [Proteobacteria bacterium]|nr:sulfotransferase domain-containing protein [Pseudomonadota bacterium]MBU1610219.1 sulfotransferase domain-containing protein [Pseudomonadota bacterium]